MADNQDPVSYRELLSILDQRDTRIEMHINRVDNRVESLDQNGTRGVQVIQKQLENAISDLENHVKLHRENENNGVTNKQWIVTTILSGVAVLLTLLNLLGGLK